MHQNKATLFLFLIFTALLQLGLADLAHDRSALLALRSAVGGRTLFWNTTETTPCKWVGVFCQGQRVTELHLPGFALVGVIPHGVFGNLTALRTLSVRLNVLRGPLPLDLAKCVELRNLYLQGNYFSGEVPGFISSFQYMVRLNLASNNFSGEIPVGFNSLSRLKTLLLENNQFTGVLPDLKLGDLGQFNVSNNMLNGSVPKSLDRFGRSAFLGNSLCGKPLEGCEGDGEVLGSGEGEKKKKKKRLSGWAIAGIVIGSVVGVVLIVLLLVCLCCRKSNKRTTAAAMDVPSAKRREEEVYGEKGIGDMENVGMPNETHNEHLVAAAAAAAMTGNGSAKAEGNNGAGSKKLVFFGNAPRVFDLEDLLRASAEVLGKGTFGTTYKALLEFGTTVAVKRLKEVVVTEKEFREKIEAVGAMDHGSLVPLRAYYFNKDEKLLVYDFMDNGSLSALLHGNKGTGRTPLNWEMRSKIALGAARGIEYLHSQGSNVSHGNIKSSNILLTKSYDARVSDFGLAQLVGPSSTPNRVAGYRAPEVTEPRRVSQKADVYSFGVLLLELLTGKPPTHALLNEEGVDLPRWVQSIVREEWTSEVFDHELLRYQNIEEEMVQLLQLAIDCAAQYPDNRPPMALVTKQIEDICGSSISEHPEPQPDLVNNDLMR